MRNRPPKPSPSSQWGSSPYALPLPPPIPSAWDLQLSQLCLSDAEVLSQITAPALAPLRQWIRSHHHHRFIPSDILKALNIYQID